MYYILSSTWVTLLKKKARKMGKFIEQLGQTAGGGIVNAGLGIVLGEYNDRRQEQQQQKLTDMQARANREQAAYSQQLQMKTWNETNYEAQMQHMKNAGLNPALMYGMSGGGGATTGSASAAGVSGGNAPQGGSEVMGMMMLKQQLENLKAQKENTDADTENKRAGLPNIPKTGENIDADTRGKTASAKIREAEADYAPGNEDYKNQILRWSRDIKELESQVSENERDVSNATWRQKIDELRARAANEILKGAAMKAGIAVDEATLTKITTELQQNWSRIGIEKFRAEIEANFKGLDKIAGNLLEQVFSQIDKALDTTHNRTPIKVNK